MPELLSRKQFFRQALFRTARFSAELFDVVMPEENRFSADSIGRLEADLTPELLAEEARRLGLDPDNRKEVLATIIRNLNRSTNKA